jgi:hypothetical protein
MLRAEPLAKPIRNAIFAAPNMVIVAQLVRAPDCGSGGRGFEPRLSPPEKLQN